MATYTVSAGGTGVEPWTLTASQVDTVTFTDSVDRIEVTSDGAAEVRVTVDGTTPAVGTAGSSTKGWRLPSGAISTRDLTMSKDKNAGTVKVVSSGTATVSINRL